MSKKHLALAEAIASFDPKFAVTEAGADDPMPMAATLEEVIEKMTGLIINGKALYSPQVLQAEGAFEAHQLLIGEPAAEGGQAGGILFKATIHLRKSLGSPIDSAAIAHGIIAIVANSARVITEAHQASEAKLKKDQAAAAAAPSAESAGTAGTKSPAGADENIPGSL